MTETEVWYQLEYTRKGANDWFSAGNEHTDTLDAISRKLRDKGHPDFDFRAVRKTLTTEVCVDVRIK